MKVSELKNTTVDELRAKESELTKELFNLRFQLHTGRLENSSKLSLIKKDIARVKTVLQEKRG
jgi:large subunit ribosomal protein L29